jgi:hypothetical protein
MRLQVNAAADAAATFGAPGCLSADVVARPDVLDPTRMGRLPTQNAPAWPRWMPKLIAQRRAGCLLRQNNRRSGSPPGNTASLNEGRGGYPSKTKSTRMPVSVVWVAQRRAGWLPRQNQTVPELAVPFLTAQRRAGQLPRQNTPGT